MCAKSWIAVAALLAGLGVVFGAFGAHALRTHISDPRLLDAWASAVRYQVWHALALLAWSLHQEQAAARVHSPSAKDQPARGVFARGVLVPWCFFMGVVLFSGSLYGLTLGILPRILGPITPLGGSLLILGWIAFFVQARCAARSS